MGKERKVGSETPAEQEFNSSPFRRFEDLFRRVIAVPKEEVDKHLGTRRGRHAVGETDLPRSRSEPAWPPSARR